MRRLLYLIVFAYLSFCVGMALALGLQACFRG